MKAEELIFNSWVYNINDPLHKPFQVKKIDHDSVMDNNGSCISLDNISGVKLTREILGNNGFTTGPGPCVLDDYSGNVIMCDLYNHEVTIIENYSVVFNMCYYDDIYVNDLQIALQACQVDKEIVL